MGLKVFNKVHQKFHHLIHLGANVHVLKFFYDYVFNFSFDCVVYCRVMDKVWKLLLILQNCDKCQQKIVHKFQMVGLTRPSSSSTSWRRS